MSTSWTRPEIRSPNQFMVKTRPMIPRKVSTTVRCPPPNTADTYPPANPAAAGVPSGTAKKKHHPTAAAARGPKASRTYVETPPPSGCRAPSAANVQASGTDSRIRASQATSEAGPATAAARAGIEITPVPRTAPTLRAAPWETDSPVFRMLRA